MKNSSFFQHKFLLALLTTSLFFVSIICFANGDGLPDASKGTGLVSPLLSGESSQDREGADGELPPKQADANATLPQPINYREITANATPSDPASTTAMSPRVNGPKRLWNLQDADILSVINEVSQETGINFVVDPRVTGKITLISSKPLRQKEVYQVFLSVLGILGYAAIPSGNVVKIVPNIESVEQATTIATGSKPGRGEEVVVRVIPLENVSATQLIPVLRPLLPQWSNISAYLPGNVLIMSGHADNLERIATVISKVDKTSDTEIEIIPLQHASALQVANVINNLQAQARAAGDTSAITVAIDERSNSILLGGSKALRWRTRLLVHQLDTPSSQSSGNTEVIYLRYLQAKTLAPLLSKIATNILGKAAGTGGAADDTVPTSTITQSTTQTTSSTTPNTAGVLSQEYSEVTLQKGNILAEPNINALIVTAPPTLMRALKAVIAKLDIRPAQVLVEAIIAEINENDLRSLGIQWGAFPEQNDIPAGSAPDGQTPTSFPLLGAGVFGLIPHVKLRAVVSLLESINGVDILSTPSVMVLDNQKATIEIGQEVSVQTGSYATNSGATTVTPFTTNSYKPVTLRLDVTPQINLGCSVKLKLAIKNDTLQNPQNPGVTPLINTSKITNSVIVNSEDVLVIGGLISNSHLENINKVPFFGNIPIIGPLIFQQKSHSLLKKDLVVFIKPTIIYNDDHALAISHMKYNNLRSIQANFKNDIREAGRSEPEENRLPPWKDTKDLPQPFEKPL